MPKVAIGWHKEDIKAAIRKRGITLEALSIEHGLDRRACAYTLYRPNFAAELVIAEFLGVVPRQIWPQRYDQAGNYKHRKSRNYHTRHDRRCECQKGAAA